MKHAKFLGAASAALMIVIVITLALAPAAGAASKYKVLHRFHGTDGGRNPYAGLIFDAAEISTARLDRAALLATAQSSS